MVWVWRVVYCYFFGKHFESEIVHDLNEPFGDDCFWSLGMLRIIPNALADDFLDFFGGVSLFHLFDQTECIGIRHDDPAVDRLDIFSG